MKSVQTFNLADYPRLQLLVEERSNAELEDALDEADANNMRNSYGGLSADSYDIVNNELKSTRHGGSMGVVNDTFGARNSTLRDAV